MPRFARLAAAAALALASAAPVGAELMIAPTRVILTPTQRSAELVLVNKGQSRAAFRVAIENRRMKDDGSMEAADDVRPGELFAADRLRATPRQLTLGPGERQTVRISAGDVAGLAAGEYRAHLRLQSAPIEEATTREPVAGDANSLSIQLIAIRSLTVPVILRVGALGATASIDRAAFSQPDRSVLAVRLSRSGTRSTYGDLHFTVEGERAPAYHVRGIAVYVPNSGREVLIPLPDALRGRLGGRRVRIDYVSTDPGAPGTLATLSAQL